MQVRSFHISPGSKNSVCGLSYDLDNKLKELQNDGWVILSVTPTNCQLCDRRMGNYNGTIFTIVAQHE